MIQQLTFIRGLMMCCYCDCRRRRILVAAVIFVEVTIKIEVTTSKERSYNDSGQASSAHLRALVRPRHVYHKLAFLTRYVKLLGTLPSPDTASCSYITTIHNTHSVIQVF